jgi:hypothetical protein
MTAAKHENRRRLIKVEQSIELVAIGLIAAIGVVMIIGFVTASGPTY